MGWYTYVWGYMGTYWDMGGFGCLCTYMTCYVALCAYMVGHMRTWVGMYLVSVSPAGPPVSYVDGMPCLPA